MKSIRIGLLGGGTVGGGVVELLSRHAPRLEARVGARLELARILIRDSEKSRSFAPPPGLLTTNADDVLGDASIDLVVEVMGGVEPAREYVERAIALKKSVVTANKMLLAMHGPELLECAVSAGVDLAFEGAVGGGIPVIRVLREALASDTVESLSGIVNGTCNFVLTRMRDDGLSFDAAVKEAQAKGYAEADPGLDVDGHDAAHKLVVLAMLAFGAKVPADKVPTEGIRSVEPIDHHFADRFGYTIKHLAIGRDRGADGVELRVHPALVRRDATLANVGGVLNAISLHGRALGPCLLSGRGAGDLPTAVSVVADIVDVASALRSGAGGIATRSLRMTPREVVPIDHIEARYYLRFQVFDRPGVLARITGAFGHQSVSIEQMVQQGGGGSTGQPVQVVMLTHSARESDVQRALAEIGACDFVAKPTHLLRIQDE